MASGAMRALLQPAAIGVLLRQGWHVYNEAVLEGASCLLVCSIGIISGFTIASLVLSRLDTKQQAVAALEQFWLSCTLSGALLLLCRIANLRTSSIVIVLLSSSLLGAALPHVIPKIMQNLEPEVWMPLLAAALLAETICSCGENLLLLQASVPTFLFSVGLHACATCATYSIRDVLHGIHDLLRRSEAQCVPTPVAEGKGDARVVPSITKNIAGKSSEVGRTSRSSTETKVAPRKNVQQSRREDTKMKRCLDLLKAEFQESSLLKIKGKKLSVNAPAFVPSSSSSSSAFVDTQGDLVHSSLRADAAEYVPGGDHSTIDSNIGGHQWDDNSGNSWHLEHGGDPFHCDSQTWEAYDETAFAHAEQPGQRAKLKKTAKAFVPSFTPAGDSWYDDSYAYHSDEAMPIYDAQEVPQHFADSLNAFEHTAITEGVPCC